MVYIPQTHKESITYLHRIHVQNPVHPTLICLHRRCCQSYPRRALHVFYCERRNRLCMDVYLLCQSARHQLLFYRWRLHVSAPFMVSRTGTTLVSDGWLHGKSNRGTTLYVLRPINHFRRSRLFSFSAFYSASVFFSYIRLLQLCLYQLVIVYQPPLIYFHP